MKKAAEIAKVAATELQTVKVPDVYRQGSAPDRIPIKSLGDLSVDHLGGSHEKRFRVVRHAAAEWIKKRREQPGLSFVLTGSVGTGKTTIIQNLRASAQVEYTVLDDDGQPLGDPFRSINSRFYTATDFMALLDPGRRLSNAESGGLVGRQPLYTLFHGVEVVAIDDVGTEELAFVARELVDVARQNRYRDAFDFFYETNISILVTSMTPLVKGGHANQDFIEILGAAAFDRLFERAKGYMFDLTGLPSYRQLNGG